MRNEFSIKCLVFSQFKPFFARFLRNEVIIIIIAMIVNKFFINLTFSPGSKLKKTWIHWVWILAIAIAGISVLEILLTVFLCIYTCTKKRQDHFAPRAVTVVRVTSSLFRAIVPGSPIFVKSSGIVRNRAPTSDIFLSCLVSSHDNEIFFPFDRDMIQPRNWHFYFILRCIFHSFTLEFGR